MEFIFPLFLTIYLLGTTGLRWQLNRLEKRTEELTRSQTALTFLLRDLVDHIQGTSGIDLDWSRFAPWLEPGVDTRSMIQQLIAEIELLPPAQHATIALRRYREALAVSWDDAQKALRGWSTRSTDERAAFALQQWQEARLHEYLKVKTGAHGDPSLASCWIETARPPMS